MMAKRSASSTSSFTRSVLFLLSSLTSFSFVTGQLFGHYEDQLIGVNATFPSSDLKMTTEDGVDGFSTVEDGKVDTVDMSEFAEGPPTVYIKVDHGAWGFNEEEAYKNISATEESLLKSKYLVVVSIFNETDTEDSLFTSAQLIWIQGNMTAEAPDGVLADNNTAATLRNDTEPILPYNFGSFDAKAPLYPDTPGLPTYGETRWRLAVNVWQQTPELDALLNDDAPPSIWTGVPNEERPSLLYSRVNELFAATDWGHEDVDSLWNNTSLSPWGRVYSYAIGDPGVKSSKSGSAAGNDSSSPNENAAGSRMIGMGDVMFMMFVTIGSLFVVLG